MIVLKILAVLLALVGIIGSIVPGIPGPPIGWVGLLLAFLAKGLNGAGEPMSLTFKVCSLIFVNLIAGVCMLCINESRNTASLLYFSNNMQCYCCFST